MPTLTAAASPPSIYPMVPMIAFETTGDASLFRIVWGE